MKVCPQCQNTYTDDSLQFCLQDGTPLSNQMLTQDWTESETIVASPGRRENIHITQNPPPEQEWHTNTATVQLLPPRKKSNAFRILILVSLALILFFGLVGAGTWILISNMQREIAKTNSNRSLSNTVGTPNANQANKPNVNKLSNVNAGSIPTPKPTLKPEDAAKAKTDISDTITGWNSALENLDLNSHLSYYTDPVDYYQTGKVSVSKVRADKQRAFDNYSSININISNVKTTLDESGEKATTVFDKEWTFESPEKSNSGKVQQQLQLAKIGGKWRITSEKDLKVYYVNK